MNDGNAFERVECGRWSGSQTLHPLFRFHRELGDLVYDESNFQWCRHLGGKQCTYRHSSDEYLDGIDISYIRGEGDVVPCRWLLLSILSC